MSDAPEKVWLAMESIEYEGVQWRGTVVLDSRGKLARTSYTRTELAQPFDKQAAAERMQVALIQEFGPAVRNICTIEMLRAILEGE